MNKENKLTIEIDGKKVQVPKGFTVLQAAKKLNIYIPTLCYHESLTTYAACRLCIVELSIDKHGHTYNWIDAACVYPVEEGLSIKTDSPKVQKERKLILELLLSRSPESEILNNLARKYGADKERFKTLDEGKSNCILCGLCIRVCNEMMFSNSIGTAFRGINKKVVSPYKIAKKICIGCTACAYVCPTGAIKMLENGDTTTIENWDVSLKMKKCSNCGKTFAPTAYLNKLKELVDIRDDVLETCPDCRRKKIYLKR
jgi:bidirectional [NiFe] hydrogenase diaphorase subunit